MADWSKREELKDIRYTGAPELDESGDPILEREYDPGDFEPSPEFTVWRDYFDELRRLREEEVQEQRNIIALYEEGIKDVSDALTVTEEEVTKLEGTIETLEGNIDELEQELEKPQIDTGLAEMMTMIGASVAGIIIIIGLVIVAGVVAK